MSISKKSNDAIVFVTDNGALKRTVLTSDVQVGYDDGSASELHLTGKLSQSTKVIEVLPGNTIKIDGNSTILNINIKNLTNIAGTIIVQLPEIPRPGLTCYIKDISGKAATNNIIVKSATAGVLIDGNTTRIFISFL